MQKDANSPAVGKWSRLFSRVWKWLLASIVLWLLLVFLSLVAPVKSAAQRKARIALAKVEMTIIQKAMLNYVTEYGTLPISKDAARARREDFTFGTIGTGNPTRVQNPGDGRQTNNSEMMAILMVLTTFRNGQATINTNHVLNPKRIEFLTARQVKGNQWPGLGEDGVYRDPWGNPYLITLDVSGDGFCDDPLYGRVRQKVFVWSFGPDARADPGAKPNDRVNADNVATAP